MSPKFALFANVPFFAFSKERMDKARSVISTEDQNYLLNVSETHYLEFLQSRFPLEPIKIHFDQMTMDSKEVYVPIVRPTR